MYNQIQLSDFDRLYSFWTTEGLKLYEYDDEKTRFEAMLRLNPQLCFLEEDSKGIVGTIMGAFDGRTASIHRLAIRKEMRKKGLGRNFIDELIQRLKHMGIKKLSAQIHVSNTVVIDFYKKLEFKDMDYVINLYRDL